MSRPLILHYHVVADVPAAQDPHNLSLAPDLLAHQLRFVARRGYRFVGLGEIVERLRSDAPVGDLAAVTFDDGTTDNLEVLPAIAREAGAPVTVYACPGLAGQPHASFAPESGVRTMSHDQLRELATLDGFEIGSHTIAHTSLGQATAGEALSEMRDSKQMLEEVLGRPVTAFAYPGCSYSSPCPKAAREAGYTSAVTCGRRGSWDPFELRRASPDRLDNAVLLWLKSRHLYDPLWSSAVGRGLRRASRRWRHASDGAA